MAKWFKPETDPLLFNCPCCGVGLPTQGLLDFLDAVRELYGKPITVTSGVRCLKHDIEVGGYGEGSPHVAGVAADIVCASDRDRYYLIKAALACGCNRIGIGFPTHYLHFDISTTRPQDVIFED